MQSNLYLNDDLYVELKLDRSYLNSYFTYTITRKDPFIEDEDIIFNGRIYYYETGQKIYLNDLISTHAIDYTSMIPSAYNTVNEAEYVATSTKGVYQTFDFNLFQNGSFITSLSVGPVLSYYKDLDLPKGEYINIDGASYGPHIYNILEQRTNILPTIPKLDSYKNDTPGFSNNFFFSALWIPTKYFSDISSLNGRKIYKLVAKNSKGKTLNYIDYDSGYMIHSENIDGYDLSQLTASDPTEIGIAGISQNDITWEWAYKKVANVDLCPADYYLIWYDRTGAYQCQPFSKKSTHSESIISNNLVNILEETRPYEKLVEDKWTINSDWLTEEQYKAYESIFTSPYHYLYDSKLNCGWWVNCADKSWVQKTNKNQKKLFNLTVNLSANKKQRLLY